MDDRWPSYTDGIRGYSELPNGIENVDFTIAYNKYPYVNEPFVNNSMGNPNGNMTGLGTESYGPSLFNRDSSYNNPDNNEYGNYKFAVNPMSKNVYKSGLNSVNLQNDNLQYPFFGKPFNNNLWVNEYDPLLGVNPVNSSNNVNSSNDHVSPMPTNISSMGGDNIQEWKIPEPAPSVVQDKNYMDSSVNKNSDNNKIDTKISFGSANYIETSDTDSKGLNAGISASEFSFDRSNYSNNRNIDTIASSLSEYADSDTFKWEFLMKSSSEMHRLESFKQLISMSNESEIPSIISYLIQLISLKSSYRIFAIKALTITLASHPEIFTFSFQMSYVEKLFIHPSLDDLSASFLRLLLSNMGNIETNDKNIDYVETSKSCISQILQICCNRSNCNDINSLGSSRLRDWICTFWYEMPITTQGIDMPQVCLSWINNRYDALYMKDGPFALMLRERDSRGPLGLPWLFENFIKILFKHSSNLSIDFQHVILMCGVNDPNSRTVSYAECITSYFNKYRGNLKGDNSLSLLHSHILDIWVALLCIPWPLKHPKTPHLQLISYFFQFIVHEDLSSSIASPLQISLVKAAMFIAISRIASPINAEDAALQVITLLIHGNKPFIHELIAPQVLSGVSGFIRRRLFLWRSVDSGISQQTIQAVQTLYDIINQVSTPHDPNDIDNNELYTQFIPSRQQQPLFPRSNIYNSDNNEVEDLSNDIIEHVSSSRQNVGDGVNRLKIFLNMNQSNINGYKAQSNVDDLNNSSNRHNTTSGNSESSFYGFRDNVKKNQRNGKQIEPCIPAPGLKNLGNTCFYNSILQALYHTDDFLSVLFGCEDDPESKMMNSDIYRGLLKLFKKMLTSGKDHVNPSSCYKLLPSNFKNRCQHDATEVARYILDELGCDKLSIWKGLFVGLVIQRIKCKCGYVSDTNQTIIDFSFALAALNDDEESSIQNLMDGFMKKEKLSGENKYFCNKCNKNRKAEKWNVIASPPIHLMVILNRNQWEVDSNGRGTPEKVLKHVHINQMLSLCGYTYYLYGSIIHQGYSTDSGHYYFVGTRSDTAKYPEKWYKMDDTNSIRIGPEYIEETSNDQGNTHVPYVLFYRCSQAGSSPGIYI